MQNNNENETNEYLESAEESEERSPFFLIYGLIVLLAILVGVGFWIIKSFGSSDIKENPDSNKTSISVSRIDTSDNTSSDIPDVGEVTDPYVPDDSTEKVVLTKLDKERLSSEQYEGVFLKMHDLSQFTEQCFEDYRGLHVVCTEGMIYTADEMLEALNLIFSNSRSIPEMYFEIDPYELWLSAGKDDKTRENVFSTLLRYVDNHPETTFEFAYSFPHVKFWTNISEQEFSDRQEVYYHVTNLLKARSNVFVYAPGNFEWLIANAANYETTFVPNTDCLFKIMLYMFCDREFQLNLEDVTDWFVIVKNIADCDKLGMYSYKLPEGTKLVFVGDSVLDHYRQSYGITDVAAYLTGAKTYNLGKGGLSAAGDSKDEFGLYYMTEGIVNRTIQPKYKDTDLEEDFNAFVAECSKEDKLTFVIMVGINDFLNGDVSYDEKNKKSLDTTYGALVSAIKRIKKAYPNSEVVVVSQYKLDYDEDLPSKYAEFLTGEAQRNYVDAVSRAAKKCGCDYLSLFEEANFNEDTFSEMLKADCIHPSEAGEFEIAKVISKFLLTRSK